MSRARRLNAFCCGGCGLLIGFRGLVCLVCRGAVAAAVMVVAAVEERAGRKSGRKGDHYSE